METTLNNIFRNALENEIDKIGKEKVTREMEMKAFLEDLEHIKKNLESAFIGTPIRVEMGMYGVRNEIYTTIRICLPEHFVFMGITSNKAIYHCSKWDSYAEEKDLRLDGKPLTYAELISIVAEKYARYRNM